MRHQLATRFVVVLTVVLALAVVLWAALARTADAPAAEDRTASVLELDGDVDRGPRLEGTVPVHDDEGYEHLLPNQPIADLVALPEDASNG
jgi:hypothetical protein